MYRISLRIRLQYFTQIVDGSKTVEYRPDSPFWRKRLERFLDMDPHTAALKCLKEVVVGVFISGKRVHRRSIVFIERIQTPSFSHQGQKDVATPKCFALHLGGKVK